MPALILGSAQFAEIAAPEVLRVLKTVEARGRLETAKRLRATIGQVFRFAVATGRADTDPTASLRGAIASPVVQHRAAIVEPKAFGGLLRAIASYEGAPETKAALELSALTFARPGEVRAAEWSEIRSRWRNLVHPGREDEDATPASHSAGTPRRYLAA